MCDTCVTRRLHSVEEETVDRVGDKETLLGADSSFQSCPQPEVAQFLLNQAVHVHVCWCLPVGVYMCVMSVSSVL